MTTLAERDERDEGLRPGRFELLRAVGAVTATVPPSGDRVALALGLEAFEPAVHTDLFVLSLPPFASIHLDPEGKLGGEESDRVAGLWRVLGLNAPANPDHLGALLALYAELGEAEYGAALERTRARLRHSRSVLLWEHLWSWVPGYLDAAEREGDYAASWARLTRRVLVREAHLSPGATALPLALRVAPGPLDARVGVDDLLDALCAPVRTGIVLTYRDLRHACDDMGLGLRRGERRYALRAMFEQDTPATLRWLHRYALEWERLHRGRPLVRHDSSWWWIARAARTALVLDELCADGT